ncbi:pyridoxamine 5'-phosphate oxidase family protein [Nonomuraea sp. NPDC046570]|uniref:pyridoxamine 5'-phosphate oxidase family protein n=1 Tax=Nonomuraea sp. NPDC046570 TaxID=3155255 RepID=UPI0033F38194
MATYHHGERAVQQRAGVESQAAHALRAIRGFVPDVAAAFLAEQSMIIVSAADRAGRTWSTLLAGEPGFLRAPDPWTLTVDALPAPEDPLAEVLAGAVKVGMIAIDFAARRRMRVNGTAEPSGRGLRVQLDQVFANCPKYLQKRQSTPMPPGARSVCRGTELTAAQRLALSEADTFFIGTATPDGDADVSHRGGNPGFVQVLSPTHLRWPEYTGNSMFLTLGNLELRPSAGLLVPDWKSGGLLQLTGTARTREDPRLVDFFVGEVQETTGAVPLRWTDPDYSRFNPPISQKEP